MVPRPHTSPTRLRILVVDDCSDAVESLRILTELWGHEVRTATDGAAALQLAPAFQPHVALVDIGMPRLNGYEVARRLRETEGLEKLFLLAVTGYGRTEDRETAKQAGFDLHLTKPVDPQLLRDFLKKVIVAASSTEGRIL
ncbi:MAG: response regulator [Gemmataceae bacterium]